MCVFATRLAIPDNRLGECNSSRSALVTRAVVMDAVLGSGPINRLRHQWRGLSAADVRQIRAARELEAFQTLPKKGLDEESGELTFVAVRNSDGCFAKADVRMSENVSERCTTAWPEGAQLVPPFPV